MLVVVTVVVVVSTTTTIRCAVPVLPASSVAVYSTVCSPAMPVSTGLGLATTFSGPSDVAPGSTNGAPRTTVMGFSPLSVTTGAVVSTTLTVRAAVASLPAASVAVYVSTYAPTLPLSTAPVVTTFSPPSAVAPSSVYGVPSSIVTGVVPASVTTGAILSTVLVVVTVVVVVVVATTVRRTHKRASALPWLPPPLLLGSTLKRSQLRSAEPAGSVS